MMDMALDDIIKSNQKYGSKRGRGRGNPRASKGSVGAFRRVRSPATKNVPYKKNINRV